MSERTKNLEERVAALESDMTTLMGRPPGLPGRSVRKRSTASICGLPLYDIAFGPDPEKGEIRGHAKGIFAAGDMATGVVANGGLAFGVIAFGGLAIGAVSVGGCAIGIPLAIGGAAVGAVALGGGAIGLIALGGGAIGYYAIGGAAFGVHAYDAAHRDPQTLQFFNNLLSGIMKLPFKC